MPRLLLIRHGQASFASDDYDRLSDLGVEQSRRLGAYLAQVGQPVNGMAVGGMRRHRQTAEHCAAGACEARADAAWPAIDAALALTELNEYDHDDMLRVAMPDLAAPGALREHLDNHPSPARAVREMFQTSIGRWLSSLEEGVYAESATAFAQRCDQGLARVGDWLAERGGESAEGLVFSSGGVISGIVGRLLGLTPEATFELNYTMANTGITVLRWRKGRATLLSLNGTPHLDPVPYRPLLSYR